MTLDIPTLMVMQSFGIACAGAVLIFAWAQNRKMTLLALWGTAHVTAAAGIIALLLGVALRQPLWSTAGGVLLGSQAGLIWKAACNIDGKPAPFALAFLGPAALLTAAGVPFLNAAGASMALLVGTVYTFLTAASLCFNRTDRVIARWPLAGLSAVHGFSLLIGLYSTFTGSTGRNAVPALLSLFGFIYFETIVFALGTAVFLIALLKERNEAASLAAARTDGLTGIANRAAFLEKAERALQRCRRDGAPIAVLMFDLDRFKRVNDQYGHAVGDAVLRAFCDVVTAALRPCDRFGRLGGEEFAVVMPGCGIEAAFARAERIRAAFVETCRFVGMHQVKATVSGGVAGSETSVDALEALLAHADAALYAAKGEGRNRIKRAHQEMAADNASNVCRVA
jgi:diguanylate cyclase (GGDEF)-like protein